MCSPRVFEPDALRAVLHAPAYATGTMYEAVARQRLQQFSIAALRERTRAHACVLPTLATSAMNLPIDDVLPDLLAALREQKRALLIAPPGAGKTTKVSPALLGEAWCG